MAQAAIVHIHVKQLATQYPPPSQIDPQSKDLCLTLSLELNEPATFETLERLRGMMDAATPITIMLE